MATITKRVLNIQELLDNGEQPWGPLPQDTLDAITEGIVNAKNKLIVPVIVSPRYRLLDGHHRLLILQKLDRKVITADEFRFDLTAIDSETEALAAIGYQRNRRQTGTADNARVARNLMRRFGWSQGTVAAKMGVSAAAVSQWLKLHPDPTFEVTERTGLDGKTYNVDTDDDGPPKAKTVKPAPKSGTAVERWIHKYTAELTNPELATWIVDHADEADHAELVDMLNRIASAMTAIAEALTPAEATPF